MITLIKNYADENKIQKRINVKKIISLKDVIDKPIKNITFKFKNFNDLYKLENLDKKNGQTDVRVIVDNDNEILTFKVKNRRKIDKFNSLIEVISRPYSFLSKYKEYYLTPEIDETNYQTFCGT